MKKVFHKDRQNVAQQGWMVQKQGSPDFLDPAQGSLDIDDSAKPDA